MAYKPTRRINPKKLLNSKWTAVSPLYREKHFLVIELILDDCEAIQGCVLEAVINRRQQSIDWRALLDESTWRQGWN